MSVVGAVGVVGVVGVVCVIKSSVRTPRIYTYRVRTSCVHIPCIHHPWVVCVVASCVTMCVCAVCAMCALCAVYAECTAMYTRLQRTLFVCVMLCGRLYAVCCTLYADIPSLSFPLVVLSPCLPLQWISQADSVPQIQGGATRCTGNVSVFYSKETKRVAMGTRTCQHPRPPHPRRPPLPRFHLLPRLFLWGTTRPMSRGKSRLKSRGKWTRRTYSRGVPRSARKGAALAVVR